MVESTVAKRQEAKIEIHQARFGAGVSITQFSWHLRTAVKVELDELVRQGFYYAPRTSGMGLPDQYVKRLGWTGYDAKAFI